MNLRALFSAPAGVHVDPARIRAIARAARLQRITRELDRLGFPHLADHLRWAEQDYSGGNNSGNNSHQAGDL